MKYKNNNNKSLYRKLVENIAINGGESDLTLNTGKN